jgi:glycosyltransferase involved in cell wall biosynthesis
MALVVALACELAKRGHEVDVVCVDRPTGSAHESLWIHRLAEHGVTVYFLGRRRGAPGMAAAAKLWLLILQRRYDVVHSHLPMPDAISGLARRCSFHRFAHVVTVHNTHEPRSRLLTFFGSGASVVYCSETVRLRNPLPGVSSRVIANGIPQLPASVGACQEEVRQELGLPVNAKLVVTVGRLCPQKDFGTALEALAILQRRQTIKGLQCLLCGDGLDKEMLQGRAHEMDLEGLVHFMGNRTDIPKLLAASDAFLSTSRYEGMPLTVLEALGAGLPCVLTAINEHLEICGSMPGCIFTSHSPEAVATGLEKALKRTVDPELLSRRRAPLLHKHSIEECVQSYERLYETCAASDTSSMIRVHGKGHRPEP